MPSNANEPKSFSYFAILLALGCIAHLSIHITDMSNWPLWLAECAVVIAAAWLVCRPTVGGLVTLALIQISGFVLNAPYNADHWLMIFLVNLVIVGSAVRCRLRYGKVTRGQMMEAVAPAARVIFLVCYSFAALSKYNADFLFSANSAARELLNLQIAATPIMSYLVWPPSVPWVTLACETSIPLLLMFQRTRKIGISVGLAFHCALILSPAVNVYDFTMAIYAMLYLFTPQGFDATLKNRIQATQQSLPGLADCLRYNGKLLICGIAAATVLVSIWPGVAEISPVAIRLRGLIALTGVGTIAVIIFSTLYSAHYPARSLRWFPTWGLPYAVIGLALLNGMCPYLGLKTQGSFTMFSNLRTEAGKWNHLFMPESLQVFSGYQDRLIKVVQTDDSKLSAIYLKPGLLAPEFEIRRRLMERPELSATLERDGTSLKIGPDQSDAKLAQQLPLLQRKLMVFRPVSADGRPFTTN